MQQEILRRCAGLCDGDCIELPHEKDRRLMVAYSDKRARKDAHSRQRGLAKLRQRVGSGRLNKDYLNNRGYNKFLKLSGEVTVAIDESKVQQAALWDGLKGYLTNTDLPPKEIIKHYGQLWQVEKAFRISKQTFASDRSIIVAVVGSRPMCWWRLWPIQSIRNWIAA